jgi:hypothetical protein
MPWGVWLALGLDEEAAERPRRGTMTGRTAGQQGGGAPNSATKLQTDQPEILRGLLKM